MITIIASKTTRSRDSPPGSASLPPDHPDRTGSKAILFGLFAWSKADVGALTDRVERGVAFVRGQLSLALPPLADTSRTGAQGTKTR